MWILEGKDINELVLLQIHVMKTRLNDCFKDARYEIIIDVSKRNILYSTITFDLIVKKGDALIRQYYEELFKDIYPYIGVVSDEFWASIEEILTSQIYIMEFDFKEDLIKRGFDWSMHSRPYISKGHIFLKAREELVLFLKIFRLKAKTNLESKAEAENKVWISEIKDIQDRNMQQLLQLGDKVEVLLEAISCLHNSTGAQNQRSTREHLNITDQIEELKKIMQNNTQERKSALKNLCSKLGNDLFISLLIKVFIG